MTWHMTGQMKWTDFCFFLNSSDKFLSAFEIFLMSSHFKFHIITLHLILCYMLWCFNEEQIKLFWMVSQPHIMSLEIFLILQDFSLFRMTFHKSHDSFFLCHKELLFITLTSQQDLWFLIWLMVAACFKHIYLNTQVTTRESRGPTCGELKITQRLTKESAKLNYVPDNLYI